MLLLDGGAAAIPRCEADLERLAGRPIEVIDWTRQLRPDRDGDEVESSALLAFALVATLVTFVLGGIAIVRTAAASGAELETLRAIGFTRRQTTTAAAARPAAAVVAGRRRRGGAVAYLLSGRYPIGVGRQREPSPGRHANVAILAAGVAVLVLVGVAAALLAAWRLGRPRRDPAAIPAPVASGRRSGPADLPLPVTMGARLALERRPGRRRPGGHRRAHVRRHRGRRRADVRRRPRPRLAGRPAERPAVRHLHRRASAPPTCRPTPSRRGATTTASSRRPASSTPCTPIDGRAVAVFALTDLKGRFDDHPLRGRIPAAADEISFAPTEMARLGLDVGDTVELGGRTMHVVGEVFTPQAGHTSYDEGARVVPATLDALVAARRPGEVRLDGAATPRPASPRRACAELWHGIEGDIGGRVDAQRNLSPDPAAAAPAGRTRRHPHDRRHRLRRSPARRAGAGARSPCSRCSA